MEYTHQDGESVTGGYVYRGSAIPGLQGTYFYADLGDDDLNADGRIWSFRYDGTTRTQLSERTPELQPATGAIDFISSFGEDGAGNLYIVDYFGEVFRIERSPKVEFVASGDVWKYLASATAPGAAWKERIFSDTAWASGPSQLGYGDGLEPTVVPCGGNATCMANNFITTYFRKSFDVTNPDLVQSLEVDLMRDDGAAVYVNGTEVHRTSNLAPTAGHNTPADLMAALGTPQEYQFTRFTINPDVLVPGNNVIAVEIHQQSAASSDMSFDLELRATFSTIAGDIDYDGDVDRADAAQFALNYGRDSGSIWTDGDFNGDRRVSLADWAMLQQNFGSMAPSPVGVPEPSALMLVALSVVAASVKGVGKFRRWREACPR
jgi:hypothetical protein